jgi:predicted neuraminidase
LVELRDGRVLMIIRTQLGRIYRSCSSDAGVTWSPAEPMDIISPEAPSSIARLPGGELLLVWNNDLEAAAGVRGRRTPLTCAISRDEGQTWENVKNLEDDPQRAFAYTSIVFVGPPGEAGRAAPDRAIFTYYSADPSGAKGARLYSLKLKSVPLSWLYE